MISSPRWNPEREGGQVSGLDEEEIKTEEREEGRGIQFAVLVLKTAIASPSVDRLPGMCMERTRGTRKVTCEGPKSTMGDIARRAAGAVTLSKAVAGNTKHETAKLDKP